MKKFKGVIAPIITPFKENGEFYRYGMENLLNYLHQNNIDGVFALGSYGSFPMLSIAERKEIAEYIVNYSKILGLKTIIQIGSPSTLDARNLAEHASDIGADAVASVVPFYYSSRVYGEETYLHHFESIKEVIKNNVPFHLYNNPRTTGYSATVSFLSNLIDIGISGMKDSGTDMALFAEFSELINKKFPDFDLMPGSASTFASGFLLGAEACVAGTSMVFPALVVSLYNAIIEKNAEEIKNLQLKIIEARNYQSIRPLRPAVSYDLLRVLGIDVGVPRKPWYSLNEDELKTIKENLLKIPL